jgi:hypothetical protein
MDSERSIVFMSVHESVDLACEMEANPANLSFTWHFEAEDSTGNSLAFLFQNIAFLGCVRLLSSLQLRILTHLENKSHVKFSPIPSRTKFFDITLFLINYSTT